MLKVNTGSSYNSFSIEGKTANDIKNEVYSVTYRCGFRSRLVLRHGRHCVEGTCGEADKLVDEIIALIHGISTK